MRANLYPIAKEGWKYIGYLSIAFILFYLLDWDILGLVAFISICAAAFVYRNPERITTNFDEKSCISPIDGKVKLIEDTRDKEYGYKVVVQTTYMDVALLRAPFDSRVVSVDIQRGTALSKESILSDKLNENATLTFENSLSQRVKIQHKLDKSFDKINLDIIHEQKIFKGHRYGAMVKGETILYLPYNFRFNINVGNEIRAGETLIGYFS